MRLSLIFAMLVVLAAMAMPATADEVDDLISQLQSGNTDVRRAAAYHLGLIGDPKSVDPLVVALKEDRDKSIRYNAAMALGNIGDSRAIDPLVEAMNDSSYEVRQYAASAIIDIVNTSDPSFAEPLVAVLKCDDLRTPAIHAFTGEIVYFEGTSDTNPRGPGEYPYIRELAAEALVEIGEPAVDLLVPVVMHDNLISRQWSIWALGHIGEPRAVDPLIAALQEDEEPSARWNAAIALGRIGDEMAVDPLIEALDDEAYGVRGRSAEALGVIGDRKAIGPLTSVLNDEDAYVREMAAEALAKIQAGR